jgi:D-xylose 1-dehydrogenase (NADP+, D-xylono-1,5-lactone-forming)
VTRGRGVAWGTLSTARINGLVLEGASESELSEFVAVASRERDRGERFAAEHRIERVHDSYEALLADDDVEAVYIPLPNSMHVDWSVRALEAGKHVLCEKPLARGAAAVERAFAVAERAGRLLSEGFMWRHNPQTRRLRELLEDGAVGRLRHLRSSFSFMLDDPANVRLSPDLAGGALMDVGCYCVSGSRLFAGAEPESVLGTARTSGGVDVRFAGMLRFPGEVTAGFECGFDMAPRHDLELVGTDGSLFAADPWHCRRPGIELRRPGEAGERIEVEAANSYALELDDMSAAIRDGGRPLLGRDDALGQARTIEALYASAAAGSATGIEEEP